ncbi:LamG-like jellyroll fold domain-containing protein [Modestobacter versicolor]|uniref:LamG-like jellyroll fold domain-containing protein n=1 Tax=Modestobacter versicolor TaxID=429133 RepID=UPI0034DEC3EE
MTTPPLPAPSASWPAPWRSGRPALVLSTVARGLLGTLALLLLASVAPAAVGWETSVVLSGSMEPGVSPGDVAVVRPVAADELTVGQVLLVDDPSSPGRLRLHRLVGIEDAGLLLQGDANPTPDPQLVDPSAVHGVGALRLPGLGLPVLWAAEGRALPLAGTTAALAALVALALVHRSPDAPRRSRRAAQVLVPVTALGLTALLGGLPAVSAAGAAFTASTANDANAWTAARYFSCTSAGASAPGYLPLQEASGPVAANAGIYAGSVNGFYSSTGVTYRVPGPACGGNGKAVQLDGASGYVYSTTAVDNPQTFSIQVWFATSTRSGGKLIGFGNGTNGAASSQYDRHVYLTDSGQLVFGVYSGGYQTATSPKTYRDGNWHQMTATFSPTTGLRLYVDGAMVAANLQTTSAEAFTGYWRVGFDSLSGNWPNAPTSPYLAGSVAHVGVWQTVLTADDIKAQYNAAG